MLDRHYAPRTPLRIAPARAWEATLARLPLSRVGALLLAAPADGVAVPLRMPANADAYAARLYAALHELDGAGCEVIVVEEPPASPEWAGVRDRLHRAARP
jgi:L-threonylcarbamoyladenylate synthase